jgi:tetratricopeptide (TPR) repeat protein
LRATARFLADDDEGFRQLENTVLGFNRQYSRFYDIVGEYADWEHRYDAIVELMHRAVAVDDADAAALAGLGLNLIRVGDDGGGLVALKRAFDKDPFNVRVFNTLNLYEQVIATDYLSEQNSRFRFRYGKSEAPLLARYVPQLIDRAWDKMVNYYGFTPKGLVGIELYEKREHFAVRTSGLPNIGIQGVCFGKTLAVITPKREPINLGMTLWHELSHVFHIQLSKSHVPRWFTEGLAEYETSVERPEWHRERAAELYQALRNQTLPSVAQMNRAFSHAETMDDMATAYAASAQIVTMLAERYGRPKLRKMLVLWGEGKTTVEVLRATLGVSAEEIDAQFREYLRQRLRRFETELVPLTRPGDADRLRAQIKENPSDRGLSLRLAASLLEAGDVARAKPLIEAVAHEEPTNSEAQFLLARAALTARDFETAERIVKAMASAGYGGYALQILLAEIYGATERAAELNVALLEAHRLDPEEAEPIYGLWHEARRRNDPAAELQWLRKLARLEPHAAEVYQRLLELLLERKAFEEAVSFGESALYADLEGAHTHLLFARALAATGHFERADREFESATLCPEPPEVTASANIEYAKFLFLRGRRGKAKRQFERALELDPQNASADSLGPQRQTP